MQYWMRLGASIWAELYVLCSLQVEMRVKRINLHPN